MSWADGRNALVTGAGSGIGRASALALAGASAFVAVVDADPAGAAETVSLIEADGGEARAFECDVAAPGAVAEVVATVIDERGSLDLAHNNAGVASVGAPFDQLSDAEWDRVLGVNLTGVWRSLKAELAAMRGQGSGAIVNTASICALQVAPLTSPYNTTKHGVIGLTKEAAVEFAPLGIRVNAVLPGYTHTAMSHSTTDEQIRAKMARTVPMGRFGEPEEIAAAVLWLLSDAASYVNGHPLVVDGATVQRMAGPLD